MPIAAMFEEEFSIDWLEELTGLRATSILCVVEQAVEQGELLRKGPGVYAFTQNPRKASWLASLSPNQKERYYRTIAAIVTRELGTTNRQRSALPYIFDMYRTTRKGAAGS